MWDGMEGEDGMEGGMEWRVGWNGEWEGEDGMEGGWNGGWEVEDGMEGGRDRMEGRVKRGWKRGRVED